ncbi:MAG: FAD-dependent oxidoreductase [Sphaerobacter sp.]|nr:FAD-dependent oxidoreductase [Sphaerobacter sp.]
MSKAVIVGGGVIGLLSAYELTRRGVSVTLLDKGDFGAACSTGNAGWITPSLSGPVPAPGLVGTSLRWMLRRDSPLYIRPSAVPRLAPWLLEFWRHCNPRDYEAGLHATAELGRHTHKLYDALAQEVDFEMHRAGMLFVCLRRESMKHVVDDIEAMRDYGYDPPAILGPKELREFEPGIAGPMEAAVWVKEERHVRPESLMRGLVAWLEQHGVEMRAGVEVIGFRRRGRQITAVETRVGSFEADQVLIAAGAWTGKVAALAGLFIPMQAGKGYNITVQNSEVQLSHPLYLVDVRVAVSPYKGALRIAGTMELSGINTVLDEARVDALRRGANRYIAGWDRGTAQTTWVGMRPMLPDGLVALGLAPRYDNLFIASGHAMEGISLGPSTATTIADYMTTGKTDVDLTPFDPGRFERSILGRLAARLA